MLNIFFEYAADDAEMIAFLEYIQGDEFIGVIKYMYAIPEFIEVTEYLCVELKLDVYFYMNALGSLFGFPVLERPKGVGAARFVREPGLRGLMNEILAVLPVDEIAAVWYDAYENDEYLIRAIAKLRSPTFMAVADRIEALPEFEIMAGHMKELGFDVVAIIEAMKRWLGWID